MSTVTKSPSRRGCTPVPRHQVLQGPIVTGTRNIADLLQADKANGDHSMVIDLKSHLTAWEGVVTGYAGDLPTARELLAEAAKYRSTDGHRLSITIDEGRTLLADDESCGLVALILKGASVRGVTVRFTNGGGHRG